MNPAGHRLPTRPLRSALGIALLAACGGDSTPATSAPPPTPTKLAFTIQPASVAVGTVIPSIAVTVLEASGRTASAATSSITVTVGTNPASGTLAGTTTVAAVNGTATFTDLRIDRAAYGYTLMASSPNLAEATSTSFDVTIPGISLLRNSLNTLARVVEATLSGDSARVIVWNAADTVITPFYPVAAGSVRIPLLGLSPGLRYSALLERYQSGVSTTSALPSWICDLPTELQRVKFTVTGGPATGYTLIPIRVPGTPPASFVTAFNRAGHIVWYRALPQSGYQNFDTKQQPNGHFTAFVATGASPIGFLEFLPTGDSLRTWTAPGLTTDFHEFMLTGTDAASERAHLFGYDTRTVDKSPIGGPAIATALGNTLFRERADGSVEFSFSAWDHFEISDWIEKPDEWKLAASDQAFDHPNAIDFDLDGNYIVSWRNFSAITKIDYRSGQILWQLGGRKNQFTFVNDSLGGFSGQHSPHILPNGHLLLYDNGLRHNPPETRAVEYALDLQRMTATLVWEYRRSAAPIFTQLLGFVERHEDGNTLITFGDLGYVEEVTRNGQIVWSGTLTVAGGQQPTIYRARTIPAFYSYRKP